MLFSLAPTLVLCGAVLATAAAPSPNGIRSAAPATCNGRAEYCSRIYSNVSQIASHDSAFVGDLPTENQGWSVTQQLQAGIRFLTAQTHKNAFGGLDTCHTSCLEEDAGSVSSYLSTVKSFLDSNPNEVVTVLLTNGDNLKMNVFDDAFTSSGIKNYTYVPPGSPAVLDISKWPTLGDMISSGQRLVVFMDYGADMTTYPYILDEFSYFFETPFDTTDPTFNQCKIDRPPNASATGRMYAVNHNLDLKILSVLVPDVENAGKTNAPTGNPSAIMNQVDLCVGLYQRFPKAVLLDYVDIGDWKTAELMMNGLSK